MKHENVVLEKSYAFAVRIVRLSQYLIKQKQAYQLADQVRRSGTSVGANMEEAVGGLSRKDFIARCGISYKEARETHYWLRLLRDTDYIEPQQAASLLADCEELLKIITSIIRSSRINTAE
ncbi:four helix bundle protein [Hymenobacter aerophilus]|uniref:four helix bundle protein n=1 Tax=Hymenobacter aerophilus TaxID=119644 RepID=UPI0003774C66|nr:four helix bundle protein [Hymenobacter aerophilus]